MAYHLYIPFKRKDIPENQQALINEWMQLEQAQHQEVTLSYSGEHALSTLPQNADVRVLIPGTPGARSKIHMENIPSELIRFAPGLSQYLRVTEGKSSLLVPEIADHMVADGLFDSLKNRLRIKLYFLHTPAKESHVLAQSFYNSLETNSLNAKEIPLKDNGRIRISYHFAPRNNSVPGSKKSKIELYRAQMEEHKASIYNKEEYRPKLSLEDALLAITYYRKYKSTRCCGLSGLLRLNGLFSSDASAYAIQFIQDPSKSDTERFNYASRYIARNKNTHLSLYLKPLLADSREQHEQTWADEPSINLPLMPLKRKLRALQPNLPLLQLI